MTDLYSPAAKEAILKFRDDIKAEMEAQGVRPVTLAARKGCNPSYISHFVNRELNITISNMSDLANALGFNVKITLDPIPGWKAPEGEREPGRRKKVVVADEIAAHVPVDAATAATITAAIGTGEVEIVSAADELAAELDDLAAGEDELAEIKALSEDELAGLI